MEFKKEELIKSPLNYVGGKYKLLPQILPYIPDNINTFVDLFTGGCNVGININANKIICNDLEAVVINLFTNWQSLSSKEALEKLKETILKYDLSKTNEEGFRKIREDYNNGNKSWDMFYAMLTHAFNYQIRFSKQGNYNMPFGRNRSSFNPNMEKNFIRFIDRLNVLDNKGKSNDILKEWAEKYNINYLNHTYGNCNYHAKDKSNNSTVEVLITNY